MNKFNLLPLNVCQTTSPQTTSSGRKRGEGCLQEKINSGGSCKNRGIENNSQEKGQCYKGFSS